MPRLSDDLVGDGSVDRAADMIQQERARVAVAEPVNVQRGQAGQHVVPGTGAHRAHQRHRLGEQAAGHEGDHLRGGTVQPLHVIDDAGQRLLLGSLRHQRQRGQSHQEPVGCRAGAQPEYGRERGLLRGWQFAEVVKQRRAQLMQAAVRQLHLRLNPGSRHDPPVTAPCRLPGYPA